MPVSIVKSQVNIFIISKDGNICKYQIHVTSNVDVLWYKIAFSIVINVSYKILNLILGHYYRLYFSIDNTQYRINTFSGYTGIPQSNIFFCSSICAYVTSFFKSVWSNNALIHVNKMCHTFCMKITSALFQALRTTKSQY